MTIIDACHGNRWLFLFIMFSTPYFILHGPYLITSVLKPRASCMVSKCSTSELYIPPAPSVSLLRSSPVCFCFNFKICYYYCMRMYVCVHVCRYEVYVCMRWVCMMCRGITAHVWRSEDKFVAMVLSSYLYVGLGCWAGFYLQVDSALCWAIIPPSVCFATVFLTNLKLTK